MELFKELKEKFRAFYKKCEGQMPEQATVLPDMPKKPPSRAISSDVNHEDDTHDQQELEKMMQGDGTSEVMTTEMTAPPTIRRETSPERTIQEVSMPKGFVPRHTVIQNDIPSRSTPQRRAYIQKTLTLRVHEQATPRNIIITKDPRRYVPRNDPSALRRAMELIANVVRANGMQPDWDPEGTP